MFFIVWLILLCIICPVSSLSPWHLDGIIWMPRVLLLFLSQKSCLSSPASYWPFSIFITQITTICLHTVKKCPTVLGMYQLNFSMISELYMCCLQQQWLSWDICEFPWSLFENSIRCNQFLAFGVSLCVKRCLLWALYPPVFGDYNLGFLLLYVYILRSFCCVRFTYNPSNSA